MHNADAIAVLRALHATNRIERERQALLLAVVLLERESAVQALANAARRATTIALSVMPDSMVHAELRHLVNQVAR
jgi:signal-transduction protein with cAMP-binding, CBS, and nucleotidyltransferase domain